MLSHIFYSQLDPQWPASLSPQIAKNLLRKQMQFNGLVLTDDLDMGAITRHYDIQTAVHQILAADIDLTLICHKGPNIEIAFEEIAKGAISKSTLLTTDRLSSMCFIGNLMFARDVWTLD